MNISVRSVIPTDVRSSARGWSNGVEEPAVWLAQATGFRKNLSRAVGASILLLCNGIAAAGQGTAATSNAQKQLSNITSALANSSVASIDICMARCGRNSRVCPSGEFGAMVDFRITINRACEWAGRDELVKTLRSTTVLPSLRLPDLRSAIVFKGVDGKRIGTLYIGRYFGTLGNSDGANGAVGKITVKFNGELSKWIKEMIPSPLRWLATE